MIVYGSTLSPYVRKVMVFGAEKGLSLELEAAGMGRGGPEFAEASPFGKMPAFRDGDFSICDSSAIIHYLEALHPEPAMIPAEPRARARTIWYEEFADTLMMAAGSAIFGNRFVVPRVLQRAPDLAAADAAVRDELPRLYAYLERTVPDSGFLVEDRLTLADIAVASPIVNLRLVDAGAPDPATYPRTAAYVDAILARPSFAAIVAQDARLIEALGGPVTQAAA